MANSPTIQEFLIANAIRPAYEALVKSMDHGPAFAAATLRAWGYPDATLEALARGERLTLATATPKSAGPS
jgi:HD-like signal output (HDOD) protein